jgi:hypothetical protein
VVGVGVGVGVFSSPPLITPAAILEEIQHILRSPTPANIGTALAIFFIILRDKSLDKDNDIVHKVCQACHRC